MSKVTEDICMWVTIDKSLTKFRFVAPNLMTVNSKCFIVDSSDKLCPINIDVDTLAIEQVSFALNSCAFTSTTSKVVTTWKYDQYFNILIIDGCHYKHCIFGRINRKHIKYLSSSHRNFIFTVLLCVKDVASHLPHHYSQYLPTHLFINSILSLCFGWTLNALSITFPITNLKTNEYVTLTKRSKKKDIQL